MTKLKVALIGAFFGSVGMPVALFALWTMKSSVVLPPDLGYWRPPARTSYWSVARGEYPGMTIVLQTRLEGIERNTHSGNLHGINMPPWITIPSTSLSNYGGKDELVWNFGYGWPWRSMISDGGSPVHSVIPSVDWPISFRGRTTIPYRASWRAALYNAGTWGAGFLGISTAICCIRHRVYRRTSRCIRCGYHLDERASCCSECGLGTSSS